MAVMRPALTDLEQLLEPLTPAAHLVAQALSTLDDHWTVYTRPRLGLDIIDFLAVHDEYGVSAITALDWAPGARRLTSDGVLRTADADDSETSIADSPRFAAHRHRNNIFDRSFALPSDGTEPTNAVRAAVIAPLLSDAEANELLDARNSHDSQQHVEVWGAESLASQLERILVGTGCPPPLPQSIARVRQLIAPSERPTTRVVAAQRSSNTYEVEVNPDNVAVRRFRGAAGSGKSFGLAARAARLATQGQRVLVLSFNVTLSNHLSALVSDRCLEYGANPTSVTCTNFHSYCTRVVQDAEISGFATSAPKGASWTQAIVSKALVALEAGYEDRYDAILIDEGQDFTVRWWDLLRNYTLVAGGEMLLMTDPTLDLYERNAWVDEAEMQEAGFLNPWVELTGSYRMPNDLMSLASAFASSHLTGDRLVPAVAADHDDVAGPMAGSIRRWYTIDQIGDMGLVIGMEVVRVLRENPTLSPGDVTFLCDYHHDGVTAAREIEAAGYQVHHIFSRDPDDARRRRKYRFSPTTSAVKGSTIHSFKGWETPALIMGVGVETRSKRVAYAAMTRVVGSPDRPAVISVVSTDKQLDSFREEFIEGSATIPTQPVPTGAVAAPSASASASAFDPDAAPAAAPAPAPAPVFAPAPASAPVFTPAPAPVFAPEFAPEFAPAFASTFAPALSAAAHAPAALALAVRAAPLAADPAAATPTRIDDSGIVWAEPNRPLSEPTQPDVMVTRAAVDLVAQPPFEQQAMTQQPINLPPPPAAAAAAPPPHAPLTPPPSGATAAPLAPAISWGAPPMAQ
jgi:hypothetical protein